MQYANGWWLPSADTFFTSKPFYEQHDYNRAMSHCANFRTAVDIGAHAGFWTKRLASNFSQVVAFEPVPEHFECLQQNATAPNTQKYQCAIGAAQGTALVAVALDNSGMSKISDDGIEVAVHMLDQYQLADVDFVKIDVEGYELNVLQGMQDTVNRCSPVIFVEVLPSGPKQQVEDLLTAWGYRLVEIVECNQIWKK